MATFAGFIKKLRILVLLRILAELELFLFRLIQEIENKRRKYETGKESYETQGNRQSSICAS